MILCDTDRKILHRLQSNLPLESRPFLELSKELNIDEDTIIERIKFMIEKGYVRRLAPIINTQAMGREATLAAIKVQEDRIDIDANAMCVWKVPKERVDEVGEIMSGFEEVTHCYERPTYPDWQHNVFTMIHGYTDAECEAVIQAIKEKTGLTDYVILYSEKEFKKVGVRI